MIVPGVIVAIVAAMAAIACLQRRAVSPRYQRSWNWLAIGGFAASASLMLSALAASISDEIAAVMQFVGLVALTVTALVALIIDFDHSDADRRVTIDRLLAGVVSATFTMELLIKPLLRSEFSSSQTFVTLAFQICAALLLTSSALTSGSRVDSCAGGIRSGVLTCFVVPAVAISAVTVLNSDVPAISSWTASMAQAVGFAGLAVLARNSLPERLSNTRFAAFHARPAMVLGGELALIVGVAVVDGINATIAVSALLVLTLLTLRLYQEPRIMAEELISAEAPIEPMPATIRKPVGPRQKNVQTQLDDLIAAVAREISGATVESAIVIDGRSITSFTPELMNEEIVGGFNSFLTCHTSSHVVSIDDPGLSEAVHSAWAEAGKFRVLLTPINLNGERHGHVAVYVPYDLSGFSDETVAKVEQTVAPGALAIQNSLLLEDANRRANERALLLLVSQAATSNLPLPNILSEIAKATIDVANIEFVSIELWEPERAELVVMAQETIDSWPSTDAIGTRFSIDRWPNDRMALFGRNPVKYTIESRDISERDRAQIGAANIGSVLLFPLWVDDNRIGLLKAFSRSAEAFGDDHIALGQNVSIQTAQAIHNARLLDMKRRQSDERALLLKVTQAATSSLDLHTVLAEIAHATLGIAGVEGTAIEIWHPETNELEIGAQSTIEDWPGVDQPGTRYDVGYWERERELLASREAVRYSINDAELDHASRERMVAAGTGSTLVIPLWIGERCLGLLDLFSRSTDAFDGAAIRTCTEIASQTAVAINNAQLLQAENRRANEWAVLHRVSRAASSSLDLRRVLAEIAHAGLGIQGAECFTIKLLDPASDEFVVEADVAVDDWRCEQPLGARSRREDSWIGQLAIKSPKAVVLDIDDPQLCSEERAKIDSFGIKSLVAIPIYRHDEPIGLFYLSSRKPKAFGEETMRIGGEIALQTSLAIDNARLLDAERKRNNDWAVLNRVSRAAVASLDKNTVLNEMAVACLEIPQVDCCTIFSWDHELNDLVVEADVAVPGWPHLVEIGSRFALLPGAAEYMAMQRRTAIIVRPDDPDLVEADRDVLNAYGMQSLVIAPIWLSDDETGFIYLASDRSGVFGPETTAFALEISAQVALAFNNARLLQIERERSNERSILLQVSQAATSSLELDVVLNQIARASLEVHGVESCDVMLWRADEQVFEIGVDVSIVDWPGVDEPGMRHQFGERSLDARILTERGPLIATRLSQDLSVSICEELDRYEAASFALFPLWIRDQPVGVLEFYSRIPGAFTDEVVRIGGEIAVQTALSIQNARLLQESRRYAAEQSSLLQVSRAVSAGFDLTEVMNEVALASLAIAGAECCEIELIVDETVTEIVAVQALPDWKLGTTPIGKKLNLDEWPLSRRIIESMRAVIVNSDTPELSAAEHKVLFPAPDCSVLAVPMIVRDQCHGLVYCYSSQRHAFSQESIRLGVDLANQAAIAIDRKLMLTALEERASSDGLTNLLNHRAIQERLDSEISLASRRGDTVAVLMVDLNAFKAVNDTYGHQTGDLLLKRVAQNLRSSLRTHDVIGRYGGDEFMIILPDTDLIGAMDVARRLKERVKELDLSDTQIKRTIDLSTGFSIYPTHGRTRQELVEAADQSMYLSKRRHGELGATTLAQPALTVPFAIESSRSLSRIGRKRPPLTIDHLTDKPAAAG